MIDRTAYICGFEIAAESQDKISSWILGHAREGLGAWVVTLNLEMISRCRRDRAYRTLLESADIFVADGMPLVWASRYLRSEPPIPERCTGVDLVFDLLHDPSRPNTAILGGRNPAAALEAIGHNVSYIDDDRIDLTEKWLDRTTKALRTREVRLILVALGVPKQDRIAAELRKRVPEAVVIGVGGTFELISGEIPRAPEFIRNSGLEWAFRLILEPRRLWRRYMLEYPLGLGWLFADLLRRKHS